MKKQCTDKKGVYDSVTKSCYLKPDCTKCEFIERCGCTTTKDPSIIPGSLCDCGLKMKCVPNSLGDTCLIPSGSNYSRECSLVNGKLVKNSGCCKKETFGDMFLSDKVTWIGPRRALFTLNINKKSFKPNIYFFTIN